MRDADTDNFLSELGKVGWDHAITSVPQHEREDLPWRNGKFKPWKAIIDLVLKANGAMPFLLASGKLMHDDWAVDVLRAAKYYGGHELANKLQEFQKKNPGALKGLPEQTQRELDLLPEETRR